MKVKVKVGELFATDLQNHLLQKALEIRWDEYIEVEAEPVFSEPEWMRKFDDEFRAIIRQGFHPQSEDQMPLFFNFIRKEIIEKIFEEIKLEFRKDTGSSSVVDDVNTVKSKWLKGEK